MIIGPTIRDLWNRTAAPRRGFTTAMRTLTVIPMQGEEADSPGAALPWFPAVGFVLAVLLYLTITIVRAIAGDWSEAPALAAVVAQTILTGGLHLDGLADWADGFWGSRNRDRTLAIMKDSRIGAFGAMALCLVLLGKWLCIAHLITHDAIGWVFAALMLARAVQVYLATSLPYARPGGGTAAGIVEAANDRALWIALASALGASILLGLGWEACLALIAALIAARGFAAWCRRRVGGITGDLLGAANELTELLVLFLGAAWQ
jgi:adenosylcobinamide-GDP ribazoletransferase